MSLQIPLGEREIVRYGESGNAVTIPAAFFHNGQLTRGQRVKVHITIEGGRR